MYQKEFPCCEATVDCIVGGINVRLWIDKQGKIPNSLKEEQELIKQYMRMEGEDADYLLDWSIKNIPSLNAVQVRDGAVGRVVYTRPFTEGEDVHG